MSASSSDPQELLLADTEHLSGCSVPLALYESEAASSVAAPTTPKKSSTGSRCRVIVMVYITHIRMSGGAGHEHIAAVKWKNPQTGKIGMSPIENVVDWIDNKKGIAKVTDGKNTVSVGVVNHAYLRTYADAKWTNNLLSLPRY